jgi:hypothetical protein
LNLRPSGYEPDELPGCSTPHQVVSACVLAPEGPGVKGWDYSSPHAVEEGCAAAHGVEKSIGQRAAGKPGYRRKSRQRNWYGEPLDIRQWPMLCTVFARPAL